MLTSELQCHSPVYKKKQQHRHVTFPSEKWGESFGQSDVAVWLAAEAEKAVARTP